MTDIHFSAQNVAVVRGERRLIDGLTLDVRRGDIVHLIGPNGCGKTSLLRVLAGLGRPESGDVFWNGMPIRRQRALWQQNLAWLGHKAALKNDLTLFENLAFDNALRRRHEPATLDALLTQLGIAHCRDLTAAGLSAGQRRRAALARVLLSSAPLWLLDEPFTNLDSAGQSLVTAMMRRHVTAGGAIVFAAHHAVSVPERQVRRLQWQADD